MTAYMVLDGDPDKVDVAGYTFGDILAADTTGTLTAVTVGSNTEVLTADSTEAAGVEWAAGSAVNDITFNPVAAPAYADGLLFYDAAPEANTLTFYNSEADVETHLGRELLVPVRNNTGSTITGGQALYITGNHPGTALPTVGLAQANALATSVCIGLAAHDIENNSNGFVYMVGLAHHNIDTSAFSNGDILYLSATTPGGLTATPPASPNYRVYVGIVTRASAGNGAIGVLVGRTVTGGATVVAETLFSQSSTAGTATTFSPSDHTHGTPAILTSGTGFVTSGNISVGSGSFTALGPEQTVAAATGDVLELAIDSLLCANTGSDVQFDAATRVAAADTNWFSSGTNTSRFPGGLGSWYVETNRLSSPSPSARYTVQAGDVSAGQVTVQLYGQCAAGSRSVFANTSYPLRWWLVNLGPAS